LRWFTTLPIVDSASARYLSAWFSPDRSWLVLPDGAGTAVTNGCRGRLRAGHLTGDGIPLEGVEAYVTLLRTIATQRFRTTPRHA